MKKVGIITIHKIYNYGSVLQAFALQEACENLGYEVEVIDYNFPNDWHSSHRNLINQASKESSASNEPKWIKALFALPLIKQHKKISRFVRQRLKLSLEQYSSPEELKKKSPKYDIYVTGSDQLWNPKHCYGDPAYMLHFAPNSSLKISYAASFGTRSIPENLIGEYKRLLSEYSTISVREQSGLKLAKAITGRDAVNVLDPTLLLNYKQWNEYAIKERLVSGKYILCYFLNYSFNAFPYVDKLAKHLKKLTGYKLVNVGRPPHKLANIDYRIGVGPEEFLALMRDAEIVLTTSFHGTAFAINYGKSLLTIVADKNAADSRQADLMRALSLESHIIELNQIFPSVEATHYNIEDEQAKLAGLRQNSLKFLKNALNNEKDRVM